MLRADPELLFADDDYYGTVIRAATDSPHPDVADYLARLLPKRLQEGTVPSAHLYRAIHDLGEAAHSGTGYAGCESLRRDAEPVIERFLTDDDPALRYVAVSVLTVHWDLRHHAETLMRMSLHDPDEWVRQIITSGVGWLLRETHDRDATTFLIRIPRDANQPAWIRETAYEALLDIWKDSDTASRWFLRVSRAKRTGVRQRGRQRRKRPEARWNNRLTWCGRTSSSGSG